MSSSCPSPVLSRGRYYLRTAHLDPLGDSRSDVLVITSDWHMPRVRAIFDQILSLPVGPTAVERRLGYEASPAGIPDPAALAARRRREAQSLEGFRDAVAPRLLTMADLHHFLFREHRAYSSQRLLTSAGAEEAPVDPSALATY